jgi:hypothetical protein
MALCSGMSNVVGVMKTSYAIGLAVSAVLITVAIEETRIAGMRGSATLTDSASPGSSTRGAPGASVSNEGGQGPVRTKSRAEVKPASPEKPADSEDESMAKTVRKMWDNPAGKAMMNQGVKMAVGMMYGDFIDGLNLSKEEEDYFRTLLGREMSGQQEMGMKLMSASDEERKALMEEIKQRNLDNDEEIKKFLNSDEDYKSFTDFKDRMPERQQLDGIRATMDSKGAPLDAETESRLVEAMHRVRTESKGPDFSGPGAMEELTKGNMVESYEQSWASQQEALRAETAGILSPAQQEAFQEYQKQLKEMQLMGLKMAEKMMGGDKGGSE